MSAARLHEAAKVIRQAVADFEMPKFGQLLDSNVGLALADWLDAAAGRWMQDDSSDTAERSALAVADAILGGAS